VAADRITAQIAAYAAGLRPEHLTEDAAHAATQRLVDAIGCAIGAHDCNGAAIGRRIAAGQSAAGYAGRTLFDGQMLPPEMASFINAAMIRNFDFNDRWPGGHPSDCLGAHLALAATFKPGGAGLLTAMAVSHEIFARISDSTQLSRNGWDQGFAIALSTACAISNMMRLDEAQIVNAIGIAASSSVPLRVTRSGELTPWKNVATPYAVRNGVFAALLAAEGMEGPGRAFEGRDGLFDNITGPFELQPFATEGGPFLLPRVLIKYWPVETNAQPVVWAALDLRDRAPVAEIESIEVRTSRFTWFEIGSEPEKWDPQTRETADHSLPYILARALVDGPITVASFESGPVLDPALRPLMKKITVTVDDEIEAVQKEKVILRVACRIKDGSVQETEIVNPLGHPDNPMGDDDIRAKFHALADPVMGEARAAEALDGWWNVRTAANLDPLYALLDL
jgi:2-methylcitrate dehydratase